MEIHRSLMDLYFGYNFRVGDVNSSKESIQEFEQLAKTANTPEDRLRYAQAAQQLKTEVLPKMQKEMEELGKKLGLKDGEIGKALKLESDSVFGLNIKRQQNGLFSLVTTYEKGMFYHNKS